MGILDQLEQRLQPELARMLSVAKGNPYTWWAYGIGFHELRPKWPLAAMAICQLAASRNLVRGIAWLPRHSKRAIIFRDRLRILSSHAAVTALPERCP